MSTILKDAISPNMVQTLEGTPALVHGGPFGNIAHGCNSLIATKMALRVADYVVTEAGFGSDLGAEKFMDIKCRIGGIAPDAIVVVATVRALKMHGGVPKSELCAEDVRAIERGLPNLIKHFENMKLFGPPVVVSINRFSGDTDAEIEYLMSRCSQLNMPAAISDVWAKGGEGGVELAELVLNALESPGRFRMLYASGMPMKMKIDRIAREIYGATGVAYTDDAEKKLAQIEALDFGRLPICMAKTQYSLSDNPKLISRPAGFEITVKDAKVSAGAGFIVVYTGNIMTMPGLPKRPAAERIDIDANGKISGLF